MKKATLIIMIVIIILLIAIIGIMTALYLKKNNEVVEMKHDLARIQAVDTNMVEEPQEENTNTILNEDNTTKNETEAMNSSNNSYSLKDIAGEYRFEYLNEDGLDYDPEYHIFLAQDGTYGIGNFAIDIGESGNYTIDGNKIILNQIFAHGNDTSLSIVKNTKVFQINSDNTITDDEGKVLKKVSNDTIEIRDYIKNNIGNGPEYHISYEY